MILCVKCSRRGSRGFVIADENRGMRSEDDLGGAYWECENAAACKRRQRALEKADRLWLDRLNREGKLS